MNNVGRDRECILTTMNDDDRLEIVQCFKQNLFDVHIEEKRDENEQQYKKCDFRLSTSLDSTKRRALEPSIRQSNATEKNVFIARSCR